MFSYNCKTGNIMEFDRYIVRYENCSGNLRFYTKRHGAKNYLTQFEIKELVKVVKWLIEERGCDFGSEVNAIAAT